ncbi:hypothetical protein ACQJBY_011678 [Aegilops geniculata]
MEALICMSPVEAPVAEGEKKERVAAGAQFTRIVANFAHFPQDATDDVVQTYARVYIWYVITRTLFAHAVGKNAPWVWLKALTVFDNLWSWESTTLAYLYRQLDDASCRISKDGCIGGCILVLSVWSWERLPVERPKDITCKGWDDQGDELRLPTWAYKWDVVTEMTSDVTMMYRQYTNELDTITAEQVNIDFTSLIPMLS